MTPTKIVLVGLLMTLPALTIAPGAEAHPVPTVYMGTYSTGFVVFSPGVAYAPVSDSAIVRNAMIHHNEGIDGTVTYSLTVPNCDSTDDSEALTNAAATPLSAQAWS